MNIIESYRQNARLSLAAYAVLDPTLNSRPIDYLDALKQAGMAEEDARRCAAEYMIIDQSPANIYGFSATLFEREGQKYLAIRGTNDVIDVFIDFGVFIGTGAVDQYQALETYYAGLITRGKLSTADELIVTGHSLGGFLTQGFAVDHPEVITQAFTYNAPGLGGISAQILEALGITSSNVSVSPVTNLRAEPGLLATASLGTVLGSIQPILIEANLDPIHNHSIITLTDSLALYDLFARIDATLNTTDPAVGVGKIADLLKAASSAPALSLEASLDSLRKLFKGPATSNPTSTATDNREQYYQNLFDTSFQQHIASYTGQLSIVQLTNIAATDLSNLAQGSTAFAYRYALRELNPFVIVGNNDLYVPHNANGELDLYELTRTHLKNIAA
jgi:pimeloyl-ACP methyl ester carboxylesterase